jgi:hypothetical protein
MQYLNISDRLEEKVRERFISDHSKFIHSSWLILSDLGKTSVINGETWTVIGLWDLAGTRRQIVIKSEAGRYAMVDSKVVANGMGYSNLRNLVTGEESKTAMFGKNLKQLSYEFVDENTSNEKEESSGVWRDDENHDDEEEQEDEYVDPLVKALRDSISDDETNDY